MSADNNRPSGSLLAAMTQGRPWGRSASFESHAARYPRQHPPSRDRIHSAALPPRQRSTPTPDAFGQPPVKQGLQPRARPGSRPKVLNAVACLAPHAGPLLRRSKRVNRGSCVAIRCRLSRKPSLSGTRATSASIPANGSEGPASSSPLMIGSAPRHPGRGGGPLPFLRRIARARDEAMIDALRHSCIVEKGRRVSVAAPSPESMSCLAIRRCGHTEVQEKGQRG